jgi:hypothetical protein
MARLLNFVPVDSKSKLSSQRLDKNIYKGKIFALRKNPVILDNGPYNGSPKTKEEAGKRGIIPFLIINFSQQAVSGLMFRLCGKTFG